MIAPPARATQARTSPLETKDRKKEKSDTDTEREENALSALNAIEGNAKKEIKTHELRNVLHLILEHASDKFKEHNVDNTSRDYQKTKKFSTEYDKALAGLEMLELNSKQGHIAGFPPEKTVETKSGA